MTEKLSGRGTSASGSHPARDGGARTPAGADKRALTPTLIDAYNRRDFDTCLRHLAPSGEFIPYEALGLGDVYVGEAGLRRYFEDAMSWADIHVETEGIEQLSDSVVLFHGRLAGEGSTSGAAVEAKLAWLLEFRGDQLVRCQAYESLAEAAEASASSHVSQSTPSPACCCAVFVSLDPVRDLAAAPRALRQ